MKDRFLKFVALVLLVLTLASVGCSWVAAGNPQDPENNLEKPPRQEDAPSNYDDSSS